MADRFVRRIPEPTVVRLPVYRARPARSFCQRRPDRLVRRARGRRRASTPPRCARTCRTSAPTARLAPATTSTSSSARSAVSSASTGSGRSSSSAWATSAMPSPVRRRFATQNFRAAALFDIDPGKIGEEVAGLPVRHVCELARVVGGISRSIGVIASPASAAQDVCNRLVEAGTVAILNFAPRSWPCRRRCSCGRSISRSSCRCSLSTWPTRK